MGKPIVAFRAKTKGDADAVGYLEYRAHRKGGGWYGWRRDYNKDSAGDTFAGDGKNPIDGLQFRLVGISGKMSVIVYIVSAKDGWIGLLTTDLEQTDMLVGTAMPLMQYRSRLSDTTHTIIRSERLLKTFSSRAFTLEEKYCIIFGFSFILIMFSY